SSTVLGAEKLHRHINSVKKLNLGGDYMDDKSSRNQNSANNNAKQEQLNKFRVQSTGKPMTTQEGKKRSQDQDQLKAGVRGPSLRQDYEFLEKMSHFVHEEIPERVVHARGYSAYGEFE